MQRKMDWMRARMSGGPWNGPWNYAPSSGNRAFDEYRTETLRRLEDEQREFREFLDRLRFAKDKTEFDQFMAERRNRPDTGQTQPAKTDLLTRQARPPDTGRPLRFRARVPFSAGNDSLTTISAGYGSISPLPRPSLAKFRGDFVGRR